MFSLVLKIISILLLVSANAWASGGGEHGGGHEAATPATKEIKSAEESYNVVFARVQGLEAKVHSNQQEIEKLILEKQHTKDQVKVNEIIKQMLNLHKELGKNIKEYDQQRALLKYRYPEKGQTEKREYERIELKSIEDMESQMSISSTLKRTLKKVRSQYESPEEQKTANEGKTSKESFQAPAEKSSLTEPVILKK